MKKIKAKDLKKDFIYKLELEQSTHISYKVLSIKTLSCICNCLKIRAKCIQTKSLYDHVFTRDSEVILLKWK